MVKTHLQRWLVSLSLLGVFGILAWLPGTAFAATPAAHRSPTGSLSSLYGKTCPAGWHYDNTAYVAETFHQVGPTYQIDNDTSRTIDTKFTATVGAKVSVTASGGLTVEASVIVASVNAHLGLSVTVSLTVTVGLTAPVSVPAGKSGYARFGVNNIETTGHYYFVQSNCTIGTNDGTITTWAPKSIVEEVWTGAD